MPDDIITAAITVAAAALAALCVRSGWREWQHACYLAECGYHDVARHTRRDAVERWVLALILCALIVVAWLAAPSAVGS